MADYVNPIEQLIHSTVSIVCVNANGDRSSGTGFIFYFCETDDQSIPCIVTNKHVVNRAQKGIFNLTIKDENGSPLLDQHEEVELDELPKYCIRHPNDDIDLVAVPIGPILNNAKNAGKEYHYIPMQRSLIADSSLLASLPSMEEIVMIGYPNGIWDAKHNLPVIRKGITATHPQLRLNGKAEFLIDAACFPGSSGSPVFLANIGSFVDESGALCAGSRVALLGILYAGPQHTATGDVVVVEVPTDTKAISVGSIPNNLGLVIHASELTVLDDAVAQYVKSPPPPTSRNSPCSCGSGKRFKNCCGEIA